MSSPSLVRLQRSVFRLTNRIIRPYGLLLSKPGIIHGSPSFSGATLWARRLNQMRPYVEMVRNVEGGFIESGVHWGYGILIFITLTANTGRKIYGFDSFAGHSKPHEKDASGGKYQPLDNSFKVAEVDVWKTLELGTGRQRKELESSVELINGWIQDTLPLFSEVAKANRVRISLVHADCDIYEPFRATLFNTWAFLQPGGVVVLGLLDNPELMGKTHATREFLASIPTSSYELRKLSIVDNLGNKVEQSYLVKQ